MILFTSLSGPDDDAFVLLCSLLCLLLETSPSKSLLVFPYRLPSEEEREATTTTK